MEYGEKERKRKREREIEMKMCVEHVWRVVLHRASARSRRFDSMCMLLMCVSERARECRGMAETHDGRQNRRTDVSNEI